MRLNEKGTEEIEIRGGIECGWREREDEAKTTRGAKTVGWFRNSKKERK